MSNWKTMASVCVVAALLGAEACSTSSGAPSPGDGTDGGMAEDANVTRTTSFACVVNQEGMVQDCSLYTGVPVSAAPGLKSSCTASSVATLGVSCPSTSVFATCTFNKVDGYTFVEVESTYSAAGATALAKQCQKEGGAFDAPNHASPDAGSSCTQLAKCCAHVGTAYKADCTSAAGSNDEAKCSSEITTLMIESSCGPDGG